MSIDTDLAPEDVRQLEVSVVRNGLPAFTRDFSSDALPSFPFSFEVRGEGEFTVVARVIGIDPDNPSAEILWFDRTVRTETVLGETRILRMLLGRDCRGWHGVCGSRGDGSTCDARRCVSPEVDPHSLPLGVDGDELEGFEDLWQNRREVLVGEQRSVPRGMVELHHWYSDEFQDHLTTTDPFWSSAEIGERRGSYEYQGSLGTVFSPTPFPPEPGTIPLLRWYDLSRSDYSTLSNGAFVPGDSASSDWTERLQDDWRSPQYFAPRLEGWVFDQPDCETRPEDRAVGLYLWFRGENEEDLTVRFNQADNLTTTRIQVCEAGIEGGPEGYRFSRAVGWIRP
ncbi:MAG: hypothetical protein AAGF12_36665 [Myxococcota bacterium]